ncbi:hypothetical protein FUAX_12350 [Fulvitalea axinellae]|uniref:DUF4290 domain-containing protein n=1 Tax=Fulvitalea axinellae TaxID=1182444 RepID=A0AAU9CFP9_9BACT|nr:hypothetical protein FUAX_12350 [Fulvitalea axinellae]
MREYNTSRPKLTLREYGRNIQKLVDHVTAMEDRERRTKFAYTVIQLMKQISPNGKDSPEYAQSLWDDLYIMSDFKLDVDSPFPMPSPEAIHKKPERVPYTQRHLRFKHYGKNIGLMLEKALQIEDEEERLQAVGTIGRLMKTFYLAWNKDNVDDAIILENMKEITKGKLSLNIDVVRERSLFGNTDRRDSRDNRDRDSRGNGSYGQKRRVMPNTKYRKRN